jgi:3-keto-L-gulonate-6-phosphate decarboxylase
MKLGMVDAKLPIVQVSVDVSTVEQALLVAAMAVRSGVDWLEYGTPLVMFEGMGGLTQFAAAFPDRPIFVDTKLVDGAKKYVIAAANLGASLISVCGVATDATFRQAVEGARETGTKIVADLHAVSDPVRRAKEVVALGAELVYLHYGGDQRLENPKDDSTISLIPRVNQVVDVPVGIVTFDTDHAVDAIQAGADIVLIGHPYLQGRDAERQLSDFVTRVKGAAMGS